MMSSFDFALLPGLAELRRLTLALAALDAVMSEDWDLRYYSFDPAWSDDQAMASMRNGSGDHWFVLFSPAGVALLGLAHEVPSFEPEKPKPWVYAQLPAVFHASLRDEPAFDGQNVTFCAWRLATDGTWQSGAPVGVEDGSAELLDILRGDPQQYVDFAAEYYEADLSLEDVAAVYGGEPLTEELATRLSPDVDYDAVRDELAAMGYPVV